MIAPFDIFRVDGPDAVMWVRSVDDLETAKALVKTLMKITPAEYLILSQKTGNKISIKPERNGNASA